jgi:hypothetical protein
MQDYDNDPHPYDNTTSSPPCTTVPCPEKAITNHNSPLVPNREEELPTSTEGTASQFQSPAATGQSSTSSTHTPRKDIFTAGVYPSQQDPLLLPLLSLVNEENDITEHAAYGPGRWALAAYLDCDNPDQTQYNTAWRMKKRRSEKLILEINTIFKDQSPLQMAAALFEASRTSQFVRDGLTELLPHVYEPSHDDAVAQDMIEQIGMLITRLRLEGHTDQTLSTIQAIITSLVHTPEKGTQLPKKPDGTLFSPMTTSPWQIPNQRQIVYAMPTPPPRGRTLTSTTIGRMQNQTTAAAPSLPVPTQAFA